MVRSYGGMGGKVLGFVDTRFTSSTDGLKWDEILGQ